MSGTTDCKNSKNKLFRCLHLRHMLKKCQVSMEYMVLVAFVLVLIVPIIFISYSNASSIKQQIAENQANKVAKKIIDSAESVYYLGKPSKTTIKVYMPDKIENITIGNHEVVFKMRNQGDFTDVVRSTTINITGSLMVSEGLRYIEIQSFGNYVRIIDS